MSDWVHSVHYTAPFYVSNNNYVKIAVDRVQAADQCMYNVLLLSTGMFYPETYYLGPSLEIIYSTFPCCFFRHSLLFLPVDNGPLKKKIKRHGVLFVCLAPTDSGKIHKVLEADSKPFVISQTQLSSRSPVQSIQLDAKRVRLMHDTPPFPRVSDGFLMLML